MSPVEFSNYIKQRTTTTMQQPPFLQSPNAMMGHNLKPLMSPSRSISPANHNPSGLSINSDPFYYHNNSGNVGGGYYGHQQQQQQPQQPYLGSHHQLGYNNGGGQAVTSSPPGNAISSSISSISSASSSSASSSVSSSSLGDHLLFGGQFAGNNSNSNNNRLSGPIYNFYGGAAANEAPFVDNGFFAPLSGTAAASLNMVSQQFDVDTSDLVDGNPTKFGVIGGGLSGQGVAQQDLSTMDNNGAQSETNNIGEGSPDTGPPNPSNNSMDNFESNTFYSGSSSSPFPQLLVAN